jgi:serine/threonine-protein kinase
MTGTTMGSLYYMSPEQIQGAANLDARADLYSVGVSLYELVTGKRPFDGDSQFAIMSAHLEKSPVPPIQLDPRLPQALNDAILMSVAKSPDARFQTARALRTALSNAVAPATIAAPAPAPVAAKSKRGLWMALGAVAAVAALVLMIELAPAKGSKAATEKGTDAFSSPSAPPSTEKAEKGTDAFSSEAKPAEKGTDAFSPATKPRPPAQHAAQSIPPIRPQPAETAPGPIVSPRTTPQTIPPADTPQSLPPPPAANPGPSRADLQKVREALGLLDNRAGTVRASMQSLQRSQAAQGYSIGGQYTGPAGLMETYLRGAADALNANDLTAARDFSAKAEHQIEILEKLFHL